MLRFAIVLALVAVSLSARLDLDDLWTSYKIRHGKSYGDLEEPRRDRQRRGKEGWKEGGGRGEVEEEKRTNDEFRITMNGYIMTERVSQVQFVPSDKAVPDAVDWRDKGYVTKVKNQEHCGSCWAFSTTGSLEGQHFKKTGNLTSLSEQQLVDCSKKYGNKGCQGGLMDNAFKYIKENKGIDTEESYPYTGKNGFMCRFKTQDIGATDTGFVDVKRGSEEALQQAVAEIGPISVAMDAGHDSFQHYRTGIYTERKCSSIKLDHGVLAVGYGSDGGQDYWIVKNRFVHYSPPLFYNDDDGGDVSEVGGGDADEDDDVDTDGDDVLLLLLIMMIMMIMMMMMMMIMMIMMMMMIINYYDADHNDDDAHAAAAAAAVAAAAADDDGDDCDDDDDEYSVKFSEYLPLSLTFSFIVTNLTHLSSH
ncbi:cathepsin l1-like [Plakobranchus ocellatus]|uniref:Cathepsin l1-like n=1 Tax=Plakobranchus ocellatus TaxID=259542 RepID=A0AAV3YVH3_9GAST|nr:cathepsin l1-like [Plakobranchus ocellatus]